MRGRESQMDNRRTCSFNRETARSPKCISVCVCVVIAVVILGVGEQYHKYIMYHITTFSHIVYYSQNGAAFKNMKY